MSGAKRWEGWENLRETAAYAVVRVLMAPPPTLLSLFLFNLTCVAVGLLLQSTHLSSTRNYRIFSHPSISSASSALSLINGIVTDSHLFLFSSSRQTPPVRFVTSSGSLHYSKCVSPIFCSKKPKKNEEQHLYWFRFFDSKSKGCLAFNYTR